MHRGVRAQDVRTPFRGGARYLPSDKGRPSYSLRKPGAFVGQDVDIGYQEDHQRHRLQEGTRTAHAAGCNEQGRVRYGPQAAMHDPDVLCTVQAQRMGTCARSDAAHAAIHHGSTRATNRKNKTKGAPQLHGTAAWETHIIARGASRAEEFEGTSWTGLDQQLQVASRV